MTDREILDQLEQWLNGELSEIVDVELNQGLSDIGAGWMQAITETLDKLRELRSHATSQQGEQQ